MASERQIAANRRNARKSTRPRSGAGKNRSSRNAYRHDLTFGITSTAALAKLLEPDRSAEAIRRVLPELRRLDRYERRAAARRDRAVLVSW
jgi:hypothetical protein